MHKRKPKHRQGKRRCRSLIDYISMEYKLTKVKMSIPMLMRLIQTKNSKEWSDPVTGEEYLAILARGEF